MKRSLALITVLAALTVPLSAQAHRGWLAPTSTVLSGNDAWVGFDAAMSNGVFIADHAAMRLDGLVITGPDGQPVPAENMHRARYRASFDLHLIRPGTYRVANVMNGVMVSYMQGGEQKRWRGAEAEMADHVPVDATEVSASRSSNRIETFVTLGAPNEIALAPTGEGIELVPVTHPNDLVAGEAASFRLLHDGKPAGDLEVTVARGGTRYRDNPEEMTARTDADGLFTVTWPEPGMYWLSASVRTSGEAGQLATNAQYSGVVEVLP